MPQQQQENTDYVFVRSKRTRRIDICRANQLSPRRGLHSKTHEHALHYTDSNREHICRCSEPKRHGSSVSSVASESLHMSAGLALYMNRHNLESCTTRNFESYSRRREAEWSKEGVFVNSFHYGSHEKNVVCRCNKPDDHRYGAPRNPEIIEQCAEYFCLHKDRVSVSKKEWRRVNGDTPPPYGPGASAKLQSSHEPKVELFKDSDEERTDTSTSKREMNMRSNAVKPTPPFPTCHKDGPVMQQELDMPFQVWEKARPSLWARQDGVSSTVTTPLGSSYSPAGISLGPASAPLADCHRASNRSRPDSVSTSWARVQRDANFGEIRTCIRTSSITSSSRQCSDPFVFSPYLSKGVPGTWKPGKISYVSKTANEINTQRVHRNGINGSIEHFIPAETQPEQLPGLDGYQLQPVAYNPHAKNAAEAIGKELVPSVSAIEFATQTFPAELSGDIPRQQHTPTLQCLEGHNWEVSSKIEPTAEKTVDETETASNRTSSFTPSSKLFNSLLEQIQSSSITDRALISTPGHKETLADCINIQREVIFGSQLTLLQDDIRIEFPQRSEVVICSSQEDVFVAQLLLINGHVDTHAIEAAHLFETKGIEPNWHADVIQPAVMLLRGWNRSFADMISYMHEAFVNLMAWAELLRLMKDAEATLECARGRDVILGWLKELQDKFVEAKEIYDTGKDKWRIDIFEPLSCDKIALHAVAKATEAGRS